MNTREEKLFVSMQQRLQQAALNDRERRTLLSQLESREESQKVLVKFVHKITLFLQDNTCFEYCYRKIHMLPDLPIPHHLQDQQPKYVKL